MKVSLSLRGGWSGVELGCSVDTRDLPIDKAQVVEDALDGGSLGDIARSAGRDLPTYRIEVETSSGIRRSEFDEAGKSERGRRVVEILRPFCKPVPRRRFHGAG